MSGSGRAGGTRPAHLAGAGATEHAGRSVPAGRERQGGEPEAALGKSGPRPVHREPDVGLVRLSGHEPAGPGVRFRLVVLVAEEKVSFSRRLESQTKEFSNAEENGEN